MEELSLTSELTGEDESIDFADMFTEETEENEEATQFSQEKEPDAPAADEPQEAEQAAEEEAKHTPPQETTYKVKFYGKEQELTVPELITAAQKGMDYDNVRSRLDEMQKAEPAMRLVERYARAAGMSVEQYLEYADQGFEQREVESLQAQGVPEETAKKIVTERQEWEKERRALADMKSAQEQQEREREELAPWIAMLKEYPDTQEIPQQAAARIQNGESPLAAMRAWEIAQLKTQIAAFTAADKNKKTAPGSAAGAGTEKGDPFLDALFGED